MKKHTVDDPAGWPKEREIIDMIDHPASTFYSFENVQMPPPAEGAPLHLIHEPFRPLKLNDFRRHSPSEPEISSLEGHLVIQLEESVGHTADRTLGVAS